MSGKYKGKVLTIHFKLSTNDIPQKKRGGRGKLAETEISRLEYVQGYFSERSIKNQRKN